ncbi:MAG: COG1361 S-layer family protein [Candidatus Methanoperedens sp.]|nr:COG1361 S-layer family protein [Candidatus Methanoperedens sp.]MCE8424497.1 COG1361 S-layer family protein [Candidatus Methanoperedens sp.]MCE8426961.1 COG1361 S-layer family protein [Candidatus Methanoperedens sp.]
MKKIMFPVMLILVLMAYAPAVNAALADSTVLSISLANYDPNPAIAGDTVDVRIGIQNIGGTTTNDLMLEIVPEYPFELVPGENAVQDVGIVQEYQADSTQNIKVVTYHMQINKNAPAGSYELKVKYYEQGSNEVTQKSLSLEVKSKESAEVIHIDQTMLVPGKQSSLKFTINNVGNAPLRDLTFSWANDDKIILPVGSDNTKYIRYIDIGNGTDLEYQVMADTNAQPGLYKLNLYLTYEDSMSNQTKTISTFAGVYVGGGTDFDVAFSDNTNGQMSFSVANIGSNPANSVSVVIPDQPGWSASGSNSVIIGNLNKGDYTVASFKLQSMISNMTSMTSQNRSFRNNTNFQGRSMQRQTNSSSDTLLIQIAYTDTRGERNVVEKYVKIGLQNIASADGQAGFQGRRGAAQQTSFLSNNMLYFLGITVLVGAVVVHRKYKSRKLLDPGFKMKDLFKHQKK